MSELLTRRRFTVAELDIMDQAGLFDEDSRIELVDGEIIEMSPVGTAHIWSVIRLTHLLVAASGDAALVSVQSPIQLDERNMPEPDLAVVRRSASPTARIGAADILLVIEVADSSRAFDVQVTFPRYAAAGIPEAWLVDVSSDTIQRHTIPGSSGYGVIDEAQRGDALPSTTLPSFTAQVDVILG